MISIAKINHFGLVAKQNQNNLIVFNIVSRFKQNTAMTEISKELSNYLSDRGLTQKSIATTLGVSEQFVNALVNGRRAFGRKTSQDWQKHFGLSAVWLMTGEGDMLSSTSSAKPQQSKKAERVTDDEAYKVPLVPISALAGSLNDFSLSVKRDDCETVISPIKDIDMAIKISGDSMEPEYPADSQVFVKKINERAFLEWGRVYVLNTCNGIVIKRLMPTADPNTVLCESINPKYPPFEVNLENVNGVYRVMMCMSFK